MNNWMGTDSLKNGTSQVGSKGWDWSMGSIQEPLNARLYPRVAQMQAKLAKRALAALLASIKKYSVLL